ncbi:unnamed protein product [Durusdinium trenchii]|uniref:Uncharacterized protein n=1 Tax=Durusdinium trenchii TaxID=1381693 RepID=A0ABP0Q3J3_9DINO
MSLRLRERSNTRLISARGSSAVNDRYLRYADVCAFHHYPAWHPANEPGNMDEVKQVPLIWEAFARAVAETFPEKPLLIIEVSIFSNPQIAGLALQFADLLVDPKSDQHRSRGLNNKGRKREERIACV